MNTAEVDFPSLRFAGRKTITVAEAAAALKVSSDHIIDLIEEGRLRALNVGGENTLRVPQQFLQAVIDEQPKTYPDILDLLARVRAEHPPKQAYYRIPIESWDEFIKGLTV